MRGLLRTLDLTTNMSFLTRGDLRGTCEALTAVLDNLRELVLTGSILLCFFSLLLSNPSPLIMTCLVRRFLNMVRSFNVGVLLFLVVFALDFGL